ncbi:rhodopsin kinase GRK7 [Bufo gargarizans]|uniref:rhodopsin kinase GRK7 n=1 Tax=Bufo gargarizans TaxID=30331 RepID=UPI001CF1876C|nr:rhodopsin kinase GRK7 [Bufo gargarizans]
MCDMGGLDNLIANTAYLQARKSSEGDLKELQKRRKSLSLPPKDACRNEIKDSVSLDYHSICEEQPIGRRLFRDFLATVPEYLLAETFLDEITDWELEEDSNKVQLAQNLVSQRFKDNAEGQLPFMSSDLIKKVQQAQLSELPPLLQLAKEEVNNYLKEAPFQDFQNSIFYDRFLQWKAFERQPITHKYFYEFRVLGKGGFGEVCAIQVKNTGQMYACKKLDKKRLKKKNGEKMALLEKEILEKTNSPFIVSLAYAYETKSHLCLVMTLMNGGDLKFHIYNIGEKGLEIKRVIFYSAQISCGLLHLHSIKILYRDMKPENVLLDDNGNCRLSDLGLAVKVKDGKPITNRAGTNGYMAPELLKEENYSYPADWFSMGCTIYEMIAGHTPFKDPKDKNKDDVKRRTLEEEVVFNHPNFTPEAKDICKLLLAKKPEQRLGSRTNDDDPRKHQFFKSINFQRLEAGMVDPPFVPDPSVVYAKDVADIADFSEVKGVEFDEKDAKFFKRFSTGAIPVSWQKEIIDTGLFDELNDPNRESTGRYMSSGERKSGVCSII